MAVFEEWQMCLGLAGGPFTLSHPCQVTWLKRYWNENLPVSGQFYGSLVDEQFFNLTVTDVQWRLSCFLRSRV